MAKMENLEKLVAQLRKRAAQSKEQASGKVSVAVGYTQSYAIYVHEDLNARHPVGQAKFLEHPFRANRAKYTSLVHEAIQKGRTLAEALLLAGLALQRDSQLLVPVDTGALKNSAFTRLEE